VSEPKLIADLNFAIPLAAGALLALIGLAKKYPTSLRYVSMSWCAWAYIVVSAVGALLMSVLMRAMGTQIIQHGMLNCIFQGLIGAALFLGIISRVSLRSVATDEVDPAIRTIRDFIYEFLDETIARRVMQSVESQIKKFGKRVDRDSFLGEASRLIGGPDLLSAEQKQDLRIKFDEYASRGDYVQIVRVLITYYEVDYVMRELSECVTRADNDPVNLHNPNQPQPALSPVQGPG